MEKSGPIGGVTSQKVAKDPLLSGKQKVDKIDGLQMIRRIYFQGRFGVDFFQGWTFCC